jgi:hypothetical protein
LAPKIPRAGYSDRPSTTPSGGLPSINTVGAGITSALGNMADAGIEIAAAEEKRLAKLRAEKQAIVDEVDAGRRRGISRRLL